MDLQEIFRGNAVNDKTGTPARKGADIINANFAYLKNKIDRKDSIVVSTGHIKVGQNITYNAFWQWIIDGVDYINPVAVEITIPYASTGMQRRDRIALTTSNTFLRIPGVESDDIVELPDLPENMLEAGEVLVTDSTVGEPTPPVIGDAYYIKTEVDTKDTNTLNSAKSYADGLVAGKEDKSNKTAIVTGNEVSTSLYLNILGAVTYFQQKLTATIFGNFISGLTEKTTIVDADSISIIDSADSNKAKKVTWLNIFSYIKSKTQTELSYACSDEVSDLTIGTLITFRMPIGLTLSGVRLSLNVAPTVSKIIVDIKKGGVSIFSTLISVDTSATTSVGASVPAVISTTNLTDDSIITISTTQIGSGIAGKGLKVTLIGTKI